MVGVSLSLLCERMLVRVGVQRVVIVIGYFGEMFMAIIVKNYAYCTIIPSADLVGQSNSIFILLQAECFLRLGNKLHFYTTSVY